VELASYNLEHHKDGLATSLLNFVTKEQDISDVLLQLLTVQKDFYRSCAAQIEDVLPLLQEKKVGSSTRRTTAKNSTKHQIRLKGGQAPGSQ
jgi:hypothetical protein